MKFPVDTPKKRVLKTLKQPGFEIVREGNHISLHRRNEDSTITPLTMSNHKTIKSSTLRLICTQSGIKRENFLAAYKKS